MFQEEKKLPQKLEVVNYHVIQVYLVIHQLTA